MRREDLYSHYERELLYLRRAGEGFARAYPKVAKRLALGPDEAGDPHVERLIESFAFLSSRLQLNLDAQFPVFTDALLGILYPHLSAPIPACGIARLTPDAEAGKMTDGHLLPRGTGLVAMAGPDMRCRFTTTSDLTIWPLEVTQTAHVEPDETPFADRGNISSVIQLRLEALADPLETLGVRRLRLFIHSESSVAAAVYEALTCHVREALFINEEGRSISVMGRPIIEAAGLALNENLLPVPPNSHPAYGLLQEYFIFPQKFLFVDLLLPEGALKGKSSVVQLGLSQPLPARLRMRPDTLLTGCVPVVNLFRRIAEPVRLDQRRSSYLVVADALRDRITEVHTVLDVAGIHDDGTRVPYVPLFSTRHAMASPEPGVEPEAFWLTSREMGMRSDRGGTDTWLSLVDLNFDPTRPAAETLMVTTLCTNRSLAEEVPAKAELSLEDAAPVGQAMLLYKPTLPRYRAGTGETAWRLVSQMALNHLSLTTGPDALEALQEILTLHTLDDPAARVQVAALRTMAVRPIVQRVGRDAWRGFCRGLSVNLEIDERGFVGASPLVFGEVLSRFMGLYASINSFVQLSFRSMQRGGEWRTWPSVTGDQNLL